MAYKYQLGSFTASGSIKAESGFDAADKNITNVANISLDSIDADGASFDINLNGSPTAGALEIKSGSDVYLAFNTSGLIMTASQNIRVDGSKQIQFRDVGQQVSSPGAGQLELKAEGSLKFNANSGNRATMTSTEFQLEGIKLKYDANMEAGKFLISDGTDFESVAMSGDATITALGALTIANDAVSADKLQNFGANEVVCRNANSAGSVSGVAVGDTELLIGDGTGFAAATLSGDVSMTNAGVVTIQNDSVEGTMLNTNAADGTTLELSSDSLSVIKVPNALTAGDGIDAAGTFDGAAARTISVDTEQTTIISVKNDSLVVGRSTGNDHIDFGTDGQIKLMTDGSERVNIQDAQTTIANNLVVGGDLTINGTTTTVNSTTIEITSSFTFEGASPNAHETVFGVVDPTADRTINLADSAGTLVPFAAIPAAGVQITATPTEINLLDAGAGSSTALASGDGIIIFDADAGNVAKKVLLSDLSAVVASNQSVSLKDNGGTLANGVNYFADLGGAESIQLPASPTVGDTIHLKAPSNCSSVNTLTVTTQGDHRIDDEDDLVLESPHAAIMLVYVVADHWKVF